LTLLDLVSVGVGGTIGSGIFVLTGFIAHHYSGPATTISFAISGLAACCSGLAYAELAARIPASGSTYAYAYVALGELPAVIAAACLTLEYAVSGAAVARSWGDKVGLWLRDELGWESAETYLNPGLGLNPIAFFISAASVALLMDGVKESKFVTNIFTCLKVALVVFMTVGGFWLFDGSNMKPFIPYGTAGVLRGATSSFFGYLGYDEVCCIAGEALNPQRDMPRAVLCTLSIVAILYVMAALALTGMQPHEQINDESAFPDAFRYNHVEWAAQIAAAGEVVTLPVVVLISSMAQPRLQLALANDGLLPGIFGRVDASGNLRMGTLISGSAMTLIATFVPFQYLDDLISAGILVAFSMTNACLILMRCDSPIDRPNFLINGLLTYSFLCFMTGLLLSHTDSLVGSALSISFLVATTGTALYISFKCPRSAIFGGSMNAESHPVEDGANFEAPGVPLLPCFGIFVNFKLISELDGSGLVFLLVYLGLAAGLYICFKRNSRGWGQYQGLSESDPDVTHSGLMRSISLPQVAPSQRLTEPPQQTESQQDSPSKPHSNGVLRPQHTI
jgi:APA family basic amino acid/polyamine antiporter